MRWLALLGSAGCSSLATLHGARTLDPGEVQVGVAASVQHGNNPLTSELAFLPQLELAARVGVDEDVDVGMRAYLVGAGGDVRYRFHHSDTFDLATAPGLDLFYLPTVGGSAQLRTPVLGEWIVSRSFSVGGGPALLLRDQWNRVKVEGETGTSARLDVFLGGGGRLQVLAGPVVFGAALDVYAQPARRAGPAWSAGVDLALRTPPKRPPPPPPEP
ncbi:MAG: hypothetical protein ABMA64_43035 [Myxococcota bacterium]